MTRNGVDPLFLLGVGVTLALLVLAWGDLPAGERGALLPVSVSSLVVGVLVSLMGRLEERNRAASDAVAQALALQAAVAAAALAFGWDLPRALSVATGLMLIVAGNATSRARPSEWFGFRTRWALLSERAWYVTQRQAAPALVTTGAVFTAFATFTPAPLLAPLLNPLGLLLLLAPVIWSLQRASYRAYLADPERRPTVPGARRHPLPLNFSERVLLVVMAGLPLLSLVACLGALPTLPERVPLHFGADGRADRYGSPAELLALPLLALGVAALFAAVGRWGSATPAQRHLLLLMGAMASALVAPLPLSAGGDMHLALGLGHALMLAVLALALRLPGPDGKPRPKAAAWSGWLALLLLPPLFLLPGPGAQALGLLLLVFGGPLFMAPVFLYGVPLGTGQGKQGA